MSYDFSKLTRPLSDSELEWKIQTCGITNGKPWAIIVPYCTARAVMHRLDECFGPLNWKVHYFFDEPQKSTGGVKCVISVFDNEKKEWISKEDGAEQSDIEAYKGGLSNALKRCAVAWGIGRELYEFETVYAEILEKKEDGAFYGKTKEGHVFYWRVPKNFKQYHRSESRAETHENEARRNENSTEKSRNASEITQEHFNKIRGLMSLQGWSSDDLKKIMKEDFNVERFSELTLGQYQILKEFIERNPKQ